MIRAVAALVTGLLVILLTIAGYKFLDVFVQIFGASLALAGVVELIWALVQKQEKRERGLMIANAVTFFILGLVIFLTARFIVGVFGIIVALMILIFGIYQIVVMVSAFRMIRFSPASFVLPVLVVLCGAFLLVAMLSDGGSSLQACLGYVCGSAMVLYAVSELVSARRVRKVMEEESGIDEQ